MTLDDGDELASGNHRAVALAWTLFALVLVHLANALKTSAKGRRRNRRAVLGSSSSSTVREARAGTVLGFYHPSSADGGGGERVLFAAIAAAQRRAREGRESDGNGNGNGNGNGRGRGNHGNRDEDGDDDLASSRRDVVCCVYSSAASTGETTDGGDAVVDGAGLIARAEEKFGIALEGPIKVVRLTRERWARAETHRRCTIFGQFVGSAWLGFEALWAFTPDVFIDTIGHASTYPIAKYLFGCRTAAYVHYPTVSSDMIERVASGRLMYNNSARFTSSKMLTGLKILYYRAFAVVYRWCGKSCSCVMVNSTWTKGHIDELWGVDSRVVYPPCNVEDLSTLQLTRPRLSAKGQPVKKDKAALRVVSVGQFRPEKAHVMQLAAWKAMKKSKNRTQKMDNAVLVFVGSCRDDADRERLADIQQSVKDLELADSVQFLVDASYEQVKRELSRASVGIHTMIDEHFGICIVEYMAAGAVPVAHASGGPLLDIVRDQPDGFTGFTADSVEEYAEILGHLLSMRRSEREEIAARARERSKLFSETKFSAGFIDSLIATRVL